MMMMVLKTSLESKDRVTMAKSTELRIHKMKRAPDRSWEAAVGSRPRKTSSSWMSTALWLCMGSREQLLTAAGKGMSVRVYGPGNVHHRASPS